MTILLFYSYNIGVFMILLNMFLAIVADSYADVKGNQTQEDLDYYYDLGAQARPPPRPSAGPFVVGAVTRSATGGEATAIAGRLLRGNHRRTGAQLVSAD